MKKIFCVLVLMLVTTLTCFALKTPRWNKRPIKVYIPGNTVQSRKMKAAFQEWQTKTSSAVWFTFLGENRKNEADIRVYFTDMVHCNKQNAVGCTHSYKDKDGFYKKSDIEIGKRYQIELEGDNGVKVKKTYTVSDGAVYGIMLHEIGHALGIEEHSRDVKSVMFQTTMYNQGIAQKLTQDDLRLLYKIYR